MSVSAADIAANTRKRGHSHSNVTEDSDAHSNASSSDDPSSSLTVLHSAGVKSHAALRKERKRELRKPLEPLNSTTTVSSSEKKVNDGPSLAGPRQNSVWVGNLAYKTTADSLRKFFDGVGEITRLHMPLKIAKGPQRGMRSDNMGFAYIDFSNADAKTIAIALSETNLDGRKLLIKDGSDFSGRPAAPDALPSSTNIAGEDESISRPSLSKTAQKILRAQKQPPAPSLFMGNLPFEATIEQIREMLTAHRKPSRTPPPESGILEDADRTVAEPTKWLRKIRLGTFEDSGKCKGWAFLDFVGIAEATAVLTNKSNHHLNGRDLVLEFASPDAVRRGEAKTPTSSRRPVANANASQRPTKKARQEFTTTTEVSPQSGDIDAPGVESAVEKNQRAPFTARRHPLKRGNRPSPGAALALAKRQNYAIVESQGQKITF